MIDARQQLPSDDGGERPVRARRPYLPTSRRRTRGTAPDKPALEATPAGREESPLLPDHGSDASFTTDLGNRITNWSPSAERLFGYPGGEAVGRLISQLMPFRTARPEDELGRVAARTAGRTWHGTGTVRTRDGRDIWVDSTVLPIMADGVSIGRLSVSRDITAAVEAERKLTDQERFIDAVLEVVGALVMVLDPQGRVVRFNTACERLSGYRYDEVVGFRFWDVVIPRAEIRAAQVAIADLQAGAFPNSNENRWRTRAGAVRIISWENTCLTDDHGTVTHVIATGIDITEIRRGDDALHTIETVGRLLNDRGPVPSALEAILDELQTRMGYRFLALYLREGGGLRLGAQRGYQGIPDRLDMSTGIIGRAYRSGHSESVPYARYVDHQLGDRGLVSEIAEPLPGPGEALGVLSIETTQAGGLTKNDMRLARAVAERVSSALLRAREQEALQERARLFAALAEFAGSVNAIREPQLLATALVDAVEAVVPADAVIITMLDRRDGRYRVKAVHGLDEAAVGCVIDPSDGTLGQVIRERAIVFTGRVPRAQYTVALRDYMPFEAIRAMLVPLIDGETVVGLITVGRAESDVTFTQDEREVFALLGSHATLALANAYLAQEVASLAIHDSLTGLYNRRHFDAFLDLAIARCKRRAPAGNLAAIMFDLDHFGDFNRHHGHLAGDAVLRAFGEILRDRLRSADIVARYGGEEFVAILEECGLPEAARLADEVRRMLEGRTIQGQDGQALKTTVSAGCSALYATEPTKEALIGRADSALFKAKESGRNRVVAI